MSVEIMTIDLSEYTIQAIADAVAKRLSTVTVGNTSQDTHRTQRAEVSANEADPWENPSHDDAMRQERARPTAAAAPAATPSTRGAGSSAAAHRPDDVVVVETKYGTQTWRFPADAPLCDCGNPAGLVSKLSQKGARYSKFQCAYRSGDDWRKKCEFDIFPPKKPGGSR